jgi:hypothetical protein
VTRWHWAANRVAVAAGALLLALAGSLVAGCDERLLPRGFQIDNDLPDAATISIATPDGAERRPPFLDRDAEAILQPGAARFFGFSDPYGCAGGDVVARRVADGTEVARLLAPACLDVDRPLSLAQFTDLQARLPGDIGGVSTARLGFTGATVVARGYGDRCIVAPCARFSPKRVEDMAAALGTAPQHLRLAEMTWYTPSNDTLILSAIEVPATVPDPVALWIDLQASLTPTVTHNVVSVDGTTIAVVHDPDHSRAGDSTAWAYAVARDGLLMLITFYGSGPGSLDSIPGPVQAVLEALP